MINVAVVLDYTDTYWYGCRITQFQLNFLFYIDLEIVGFIEIGDISSPPVLSRHLVLPIAVSKGWCFAPCSLILFTCLVFDRRTFL